MDETRLEEYLISLHMDFHDHSLFQVLMHVYFKGHKTTGTDKELNPYDRKCILPITSNFHMK